MKILILNLFIVAIVMAAHHAGERRLADRIAALRTHGPGSRPAKNLNSGH
jgi:hypothetical protein